MAFDKTAARGPSRTRSAVSKARLEGPLPPPPLFRGFLVGSPSSPSRTAQLRAGGEASGRGVVAPPGRQLCPVRLRIRGGGGEARSRRLPGCQRCPPGKGVGPEVSTLSRGLLGTPGSGWPERGAPAGRAQARTAAALPAAVVAGDGVTF
uniref:Uncharacterized protein n=1 Tax=Rangifer tarandus platyrhynchus TaxID=3082113 RepID=A0ACB0F2U7_RANTA|nr:unnamed protein product [Rangifer tarandus platyrhynchus]